MKRTFAIAFSSIFIFAAYSQTQIQGTEILKIHELGTDVLTIQRERIKHALLSLSGAQFFLPADVRRFSTRRFSANLYSPRESAGIQSAIISGNKFEWLSQNKSYSHQIPLSIALQFAD
jgi:hypothetical protein